jgi:amino-acid N-acetyltransferase
VNPTAETLSFPGDVPSPVVPFDLAPVTPIEVRAARPDEAAAVHALIEAHVAEGHLLPRRREDVEARIARFVVAVRHGDAAGDAVLVGAAELAPLSSAVAEVRSLVVRDDARHDGVGRRIVAALAQRARLEGFDTLAAFTHGPGFFVRLGFSIVPHHWVREKILVDCQSCALFRRCGQSAVVLSLTARGRAGRPATA